MEKLAELIAGAAERLGVETVRIWPQIVMVTWVKAAMWSVTEPLLVIACIAVAVSIFRRLRAHIAGARDFMDTDPFVVTGGGMAIAALCVVAFVAFSDWPNQIAAAFYPEAATVLRMVGK